MVKVDGGDGELTADARVKIINQLPKEISEAGAKIHKAVGGSSAADFLSVMEESGMGFCDVMLRKADKKRDRQILFGHRQQLLEQVTSCRDPALALHVASLALFQHYTGHMLHASGKFVPAILDQVEEHLSEEQVRLLREQQQLVVAQLSSTAAEDQTDVEQLEKTTAAIREMVVGLRKKDGDKD